MAPCLSVYPSVRLSQNGWKYHNASTLHDNLEILFSTAKAADEIPIGSPLKLSPDTQELIRRSDSERELLRSAPRKLPEFAEITQNNGNYAVQRHSRSPILVPIESVYAISY